MKLLTEPYLEQVKRLPLSGRHILAQFDQDSVVVYQAYNVNIGKFAAQHGYFGGEFLFDRMSWIKPSFLWMMYRSGWGTKVNQEVILAIWIKRSAFDEILAKTVPSSYIPDLYPSREEWQQAVKRSDVRLQWDSDYNPCQKPVERRAIQLGLRGEILARYAKDFILDIQDISEFVHEQYPNRLVRNQEQLLIPLQSVYLVNDSTTIKRIGLSHL